SYLRHRDWRVHHGEPAQSAGLRSLPPEHRRQSRLRAGGARRHRLCDHLGLHVDHPGFGPLRPEVGEPAALNRRNSRMADAFLKIQGVKKDYGPTTVVQDFNLDIKAGEFVSFLGPSGCGKTTVLRMVAGFETPSAGAIVVGGKDVTSLKPNQRNIGMVFQAYALFPNLTVAQNIGFGLKVAGVPKAQADARVAEMLETIRLPEFGGRYPYQLSGGQQQRVALARALAPKPKLLLLDEPLSALDAKVRVSLREEIRTIQKKLGITTVFVTHDQEEALSISDRIAVMYGGKAEQIGTPFEIYNRPATRFVANFVGTLNVLEGTVTDPGAGKVRVGSGEIELKRSLNGAQPG